MVYQAKNQANDIMVSLACLLQNTGMALGLDGFKKGLNQGWAEDRLNPTGTFLDDVQWNSQNVYPVIVSQNKTMLLSFFSPPKVARPVTEQISFFKNEILFAIHLIFNDSEHLTSYLKSSLL